MSGPFDNIIAALREVVLGKERAIRLSLTCLMSGGHLLLEDIPGIGKTTLALSLARVLGLDFARIQFTSDLLPADITGVSIFDPRAQAFTFRPGPIFHQLVLADEINRAMPKTQSALLEAMGEGQVSAEGHTYELRKPFFVVATENPVEQFGTFPLPESQLDRFAMSLRMDYPNRAAETQLLTQLGTRERIQAMSPLLDQDGLGRLQSQVARVEVGSALVDYVLDLAWATRRSERLRMGLSPRGCEALVKAAKAWAFMNGRAFCVPEDVQAVAVAVLRHRLLPRGDYSSWKPEQLAESFLQEVPIP